LDQWCIVNCKGLGRKRYWHGMRYYPGICVEEMRKTKEFLSQINECENSVANRAPSEDNFRSHRFG